MSNQRWETNIEQDSPERSHEYNAVVAGISGAEFKRLLWKVVVGCALALVAAVLLAYVADYAVFRRRVANNQAFGQVVVSNYDAVQQKNGKTEFLFDPPQAQTCVNALFPRQGLTPCWYLSRHTEQRTNI